MDSADRCSHVEPASTAQPHKVHRGNRRDRVARAAALRARIRELQDGSAVVPADEATDSASARVIRDQGPVHDGHRRCRRASCGRRTPILCRHSRGAPESSHPAVKRPRWLEGSQQSSDAAVLVVAQQPSSTGHPLRSAPSWLVSAIVHSVLLIACGLFTIRQYGNAPRNSHRQQSSRS